MDLNATRGMLGGVPTSTSSQPSEQIRGALPRAVTSLSRRYPQLLRVLARFRTELAEPVHRAMTLRVRAMRSARRDRVNEAPMRAAHLLRSETGAGAFAFIDSIPRLRLPRAIES